MKIPTNLFKFSFIALGWIVFILLCYVAFKDEKTNVLITMKDSLREAINIDYQERLNKILIHYRPLGRKVKGVQIEYGDSLEIIYFEDSTHESLATQLANQYVMTRIILSILTISIRSSKKNGKRMEFPPLRRESFTATTRKRYSVTMIQSLSRKLLSPLYKQ